MNEPTEHQIRAALEVARVVDAAGNPTGDVRDAYRHLLTLGEHTSRSLEAGERLLIDLGLLIQADGRLYPSDALAVLAHIDHVEGENAIRTRNQALADQDLADRVQQVSLVDNSLGYDVTAPALAGETRHLEVKTTTRANAGVFSFYLSRNEYEVGRDEPAAWAIVACTWDQGTDADIIGWCRASALLPYLPSDASGHWTEARVRIPLMRLFPGIPPAA